MLRNFDVGQNLPIGYQSAVGRLLNVCIAAIVAVLVTICLSGGVAAQYRAGEFVNGQPVFRKFRPSFQTQRVKRRQLRVRRSVRSEKRRAARRTPRQRIEVRKRAIPRQLAVSKVAEAVAAKKATEVVAVARAASRLTVARSALIKRANESQGKLPKATVPPADENSAARAMALPVLSSPERRQDGIDKLTRVVALPVPLLRSIEAPESGAVQPHPQAKEIAPPKVPAIARRSANVPLPTKYIVRKQNKVMQLVVSLKGQNITVYQNDRQVSRSPVSTGQAGHRTPTGVFSIIQKNRFHRSNIYSGAPMPFMQRITWSGIALHLGNVPGYPASHGCIRLPGHFALKLFKATTMRTHVVISDESISPRRFSHPNLPGMTDVDQQRLAVLAGPPSGVAHGRSSQSRDNLAVTPVSWTVAEVSGDGKGAESSPSLNSYSDDPELYQLAALLHYDRTEQLAYRRMVVTTRKSSPLRILVTRRTAQDKTRDVQRQLLSLGYDVGELDGRIGRQMIGATKAFQRTHDLRVTGLPDEATRAMLSTLTGSEFPSEATVYVRQDGRDIYSGPAQLARSGEPLGTHLYTMIDFQEGQRAAEWTAMTLQEKGRLPEWLQSEWRRRSKDIVPVNATQAISRVTFPEHVRQFIEDRLTPGSSLVIADSGSDRETGNYTDFIVLTD